MNDTSYLSKNTHHTQLAKSEFLLNMSISQLKCHLHFFLAIPGACYDTCHTCSAVPGNGLDRIGYAT